MTVDADAKTGLKQAVAELHDPAAAVPGNIDGPQLDMLALGRIAEEKNLPVARGRGRPPGAKNKNTEQWRDYLLSRYSSPLEGLAFTASMDVAELSKSLSCTKLEAFKLQLMAMRELAPYVHQKMPIALEAGAGGLISLVINANAAAAAAGPANAPVVIEMLNTKPEQNQIFTADDHAKSNGATSNSDSEPADTEGKNNYA
ncbi:MAG: hypothetical protein PSY14_06775 [bacterium]|nr:hypothetical protein [bacterium]